MTAAKIFFAAVIFELPTFLRAVSVLVLRAVLVLVLGTVLVVVLIVVLGTVLVLVAVLGIVILRIHVTSSENGLRKPAAVAYHAAKKLFSAINQHFLLR